MTLQHPSIQKVENAWSSVNSQYNAVACLLQLNLGCGQHYLTPRPQQHHVLSGTTSSAAPRTQPHYVCLMVHYLVKLSEMQRHRNLPCCHHQAMNPKYWQCRLYNTSYKTPSQLYMLLIIILILSQDKGFSQNIQGVMLGSVPWYKERMLQKTSLGKLVLSKGCTTTTQLARCIMALIMGS